MDERIKDLKKIILDNLDKKVLVVCPIREVLREVCQKIMIGELYDDIFSKLLDEEFGYIYSRYIPDTEQKRIEKTIKVKRGIPLFSSKIIDSDVIIFLYIDPKMLKVICFQKQLIYSGSLYLQNELIKQLDFSSNKVIKFNLCPSSSEVSKIGRNVYICDDGEWFLSNKRDLESDYYDEESFFRFPYIKIVDDINDLKRKQGFLLIIDEKYLKTSDYIEIDKKYRHLFNQFNLVYILTNDLKKQMMYQIKFTNVYFVEKDYFDDQVLVDTYCNYILNTKKIKFSKKKLLLLNEINDYLKNKKTIKTNELVNVFHINPRKVERYMNDINKIYKNIGYDYLKNEWYIIK